MHNIVYFNGSFIPKENAQVSVMDRGFLFGDGVYEVVPVFNGHMFQVDEHLDRLQKSLNAIELKTTISNQEIKNILKELLRQNEHTDSNCVLYLQITRGPQEYRNHQIPEKINPTIVAFCMPAKVYSKEELAQGYGAIIEEDTRRRDCYIKEIGLLPSVLLYHRALKSGSVEAILIRDGYVMEGTLSNVFLVKNNELYTPPISPSILNGVTRQLIITIANRNHIPVHEKDIPAEMLYVADEIWMTGSSKEICPITTLNGKKIGHGKTGPMWYRMMDLYEAEKIKSREKVSQRI